MVVSCVLLTGCISDQSVGNGVQKTPSTTVPVSVSPTVGHNTSNPITLQLTLSKIPVTNEQTTLHVDVNCIFDAPDTNVSIILPSNVEVIQGMTEEKLDLKANTTESLEVTIKFTQPGDYKITAAARKVIDQENSWGDMGVLYLSIGDTISNITTYVPTASGANSLSGTKLNNQTG